jgi:DNA polymerase I
VTNAVFGFTRMLIRLLKDIHPDGLAVAWDVSRKTFRTEAVSRVQGAAGEGPRPLPQPTAPHRRGAPGAQVTQLRREGYEADDLIASLTKKAVAEDWDVLIVTGDRDAFQLVGDPIKVMYTRCGASPTR